MINKLLSHLDFKSLFNLLGEAVVYIDVSGTIAYMNKTAVDLFNAFNNFSVGQSIYDQTWRLFDKKHIPVPGEDFPAIRVLKTGLAVHDSILQLVAADGKITWLDINADPILDEHGKALKGVLLTIVNLTETMIEKQRLRYKEEQYKNYFHSNISATFLATKSGQYLDVSGGAEAIFGYTSDELKVLGREHILVNDDAFRLALQKRNATGSIVAQISGRRKNGEIFPLLWTANIFTTSAGDELVSVVMVDLTEKMELEKKATESAYNLDLILNNVDEAFAITDENFRFITFNKAYAQTIESFYGKTIYPKAYLLDIVSDEHRDWVRQLLNNVLAGNKEVLQRSHVETGRELFYETTLQPLWRGGRVIGVFVTRKNVTDIVNFAKQTKDLQFNLDLVMQNSEDGIAILDSKFILQAFNDAFDQAMRLTHFCSVAVGDYLPDLLLPERKPVVEQQFDRALGGERREFVFKCNDENGKPLVYASTLTPLQRDGVVIGIFILVKNITKTHLADLEAEKAKAKLERASLASFEGILEIDLSTGKAISRSDAFRKELGYDPALEEEWLQSIDRIAHPDDFAKYQEFLSEKLAKDDSLFTVPFPVRIRHKEGYYKYFEQRIYVSRNDEGKAVLLTVASRDVTRYITMQTELQISNQAFKRAFKASYHIISERDLVTGALTRNNAFTDILGYNETDFPDLHEAEKNLVHPDDQEMLRSSIDEQLKEGLSSIKFPVHRVRHKDGHYLHFVARMLVTRDKDGKPTMLTTVSTNVSDFIELQQALSTTNLHLQNQAEELRRSNAELERFAYVASHDLQEPLRMVSSFLSLLKKRYDPLLDETGRQYIHFAVDGASRMKKLIHDLLHFSRLGTQKDEKEEICTANLVAGLLEEFVFTINEKKAKVQLHNLPTVYANRSGLTHVFQNLLSNALKYAEYPVIDIGATDEGEYWQFFVKDNGIGIEEKYFEKIFIIFQQLHSKNEYSGTGIGLAIVKKVIEQQGGRIWLQSKPGEGSTFHFSIPKNKTN